MLSRAAEALWWTGRYLGRAEALARALLGHRSLALEAGGEAWPWLMAAWGQPEALAPAPRPWSWPEVVSHLVLEGANPWALRPSLGAARTSGREVLDHFSSEAWGQLNALHLEAEAWRLEPLAQGGLAQLQAILTQLHAFWGTVGGTMLEDEAVAFLRFGHDLEAALGLLRVLQAPAFARQGEGDHHLDAALRAAGAHEAIHRALGHPPGPAEATRFLLAHPKFPRALCHLVARLRQAAVGPLGFVGASAAVEGALHPLAWWAEGAQAGDVAGAQGAREALEAAGEALAVAAGFGERRPPAPKEAVPHRRAPFPASPGPGLVEARLRVHQVLSYRYPQGASEVDTLTRLAPPPRRLGQWVLQEGWSLSPPAPSQEGLDAWGNPTKRFLHPQVAEELSLELSFEVARSVPYLPDGRPWPLGPGAGPLATPEEAEALLASSPLTEPSEGLRAAAAAADPGPGAPLPQRIEALAGALREGMAYRPGHTQVHTTAAEAWALGLGVCQDFAHVFLAMARSVGLPARYASGYVVGEGAMHAWVELALPGPQGLAWVGYDPTQGTWVHEEHVAVATGPDYAAVSPNGGRYRGAPGSTLGVQVRCELLERSWGPLAGREPSRTGPLVGAWLAAGAQPQQEQQQQQA